MSAELFSPLWDLQSSRTSWAGVFQRSRGGGRAYSKEKAEAAAAEEAEKAAEEEFQKEDKVKDPPPPSKSQARLFNPRWGGPQAYFDEKMTLSIEGELPPENSHLTRVTFTVHALKDGEVDRIGAQEAHLKDGKAVAEILLWTPKFKDAEGNPVRACEYAFVAKHRDSPEVESEAIPGMRRGTEGGPGIGEAALDVAVALKGLEVPKAPDIPEVPELPEVPEVPELPEVPQVEVPKTAVEFELFKDGKTPRAGERYVLTDSLGKVFQGTLDGMGKARVEGVAPGEATVAFPDLEKLNGSVTSVGGEGTSSFYLRILMNPEEAMKLEEKFILASADGAFTQIRTAADDLILGDNFIDLRFTDLPTDLAYTLKIEIKDRPAYTVFKDVPFAKLNGFVEEP